MVVNLKEQKQQMFRHQKKLEYLLSWCSQLKEDMLSAVCSEINVIICRPHICWVPFGIVIFVLAGEKTNEVSNHKHLQQKIKKSLAEKDQRKPLIEEIES